jgi:branched-chain amino acid transport system permease protein
VNCVFVLSLALVLGQAGIASVGHATFFGAGAYAAGLFALHVSGDPLLGLLAGAIAGGLFAALSGLIIMRAYGAALVVLTAALAQLVAEIANKARWVTGGADGLSNFHIAPLFGRFDFDFYGKVGFLYALGVLALGYFVSRKIVASPFGLTSRAIRSEHRRMPLLGCNVYLHLLAAFTIGGAMAGVAGSLQAQTTGVVGLSTVGFGLSAMAIVMLVLGGTRRLPGAILGTVVYQVIQRVASAFDPAYWLFAVGALLILTLTVMPNGLMQIVDAATARLRMFGPGRGPGSA